MANEKDNEHLDRMNYILFSNLEALGVSIDIETNYSKRKKTEVRSLATFFKVISILYFQARTLLFCRERQKKITYFLNTYRAIVLFV